MNFTLFYSSWQTCIHYHQIFKGSGHFLKIVSYEKLKKPGVSQTSFLTLTTESPTRPPQSWQTNVKSLTILSSLSRCRMHIWKNQFYDQTNENDLKDLKLAFLPCETRDCSFRCRHTCLIFQTLWNQVRWLCSRPHSIWGSFFGTEMTLVSQVIKNVILRD